MYTGFHGNAGYKLQTGDVQTFGAQFLPDRDASSERVSQAFPYVAARDENVVSQKVAPCNSSSTVVSVEACYLLQNSNKVSCKPKRLLGKQVSLRQTQLLFWCRFSRLTVHTSDASDHFLISNLLVPADSISNFELKTC